MNPHKKGRGHVLCCAPHGKQTGAALLVPGLRRGSVCMRLAGTCLVSLLVQASFASESCLPGWTHTPTACLKVLGSALPWDDAATACAASAPGTVPRLASFGTSAEVFSLPAALAGEGVGLWSALALHVPSASPASLLRSAPEHVTDSLGAASSLIWRDGRGEVSLSEALSPTFSASGPEGCTALRRSGVWGFDTSSEPSQCAACSEHRPKRSLARCTKHPPHRLFSVKASPLCHPT